MYPYLLPGILLFLLFASVLFFAYARMHRFRRKTVLNPHQFSRLFELAGRSLESLDVPVGAILLYRGEVIGEGYNTVLRNARAGEHAEVNAISDAIMRLGMEAFVSLERDSLKLVTTFEPCLMCAGACINYNIRHVYFLKEKDIFYTGREAAHFIRYAFSRKQVRHDGEQDALFEQHPMYPPKRG